jgi:hypothetical protein
MSAIPFGYYQGNRAEYLAIPALSKLGFTIPVPRQEDHFGVDFIVHLAIEVNSSVIPTGRSFAIQIKSNEQPLSYETPEKRQCLCNMTIPFFLGIVSRKSLKLKIYSTLDRIAFFWKRGLGDPFQIKPANEYQFDPSFATSIVWTGKPILEVNINDPPKANQRKQESTNIQNTMLSWVDLENENLSRKNQNIPIYDRPKLYHTNTPVAKKNDNYERVSYANIITLPNICKHMNDSFVSYQHYLNDCASGRQVVFPPDIQTLLQELKVISKEFILKNTSLHEECIELLRFHNGTP